jgi:hypothetical protein
MTESPKPSPRPPSKSRHNARDAPPSSPSSKKLNGPPPPSSAHSIDLPSQTTPITPSPLPQPKPISTLPTLVQQEKESRHQLATQRLEWAKELLRYVQRTQPTILAPSPPPSSSSSSVNASKKNPLLGPDLTYDITDSSPTRRHSYHLHPLPCPSSSARDFFLLSICFTPTRQTLRRSSLPFCRSFFDGPFPKVQTERPEDELSGV